MEDFNTGTLPHKKYYDLDVYERRRAAKAAKKGPSAVRPHWRRHLHDAERAASACTARKPEHSAFLVQPLSGGPHLLMCWRSH